ncbi:MAG: hypothetical protein KDE23_07370 [Caldilinea sp.]|nr:hypothetical protein [Caldilinea sp.]
MLALVSTVPFGWFVTPDPGEVDADTVTPGVIGFVVTLALAVIVVLLVVDMVRRTRRVNHRAQVAAKLDAEEAAARGDEAPSD